MPRIASLFVLAAAGCVATSSFAQTASPTDRQSIQAQVDASCQAAAASYDPPDTVGMVNIFKSGRLDEAEAMAKKILSFGLFGPPPAKELCAKAVIAAIPVLKAEAKATQEARDGQGTAMSISALKSSCPTNGGLGVGIEAIFYNLDSARYDDVNRQVDSLRSQDASAAELKCLNNIRASLPALQQGFAAHQAEVRRQATVSAQIGSATCVAEPGTDGSANAAVQGMMRAYQSGAFDEALAAADIVLSYHLQVITESQKDCALKISSAIKAERQKEASKPTNQLKDVYKFYIAMQACFEARKEFRVQYVSKQEMDAARAITRRDEQALLKQFAALAKQKDALWNQAKQEYGASDLAVILRISGTAHTSGANQGCKLVAIRYTTDTNYQQQQIKKDF